MPIKLIVKQLFFLIAILLISVVLVHFMALFGIFLAIAIPILHIIFYPRIICFWCQLKHGTHSLRHSLIDALLIVLVTLISIGVVIIEARVLQHLGYPKTEQTASFLIPTRSQHKLKEVFPMKIELVGIQTPINAIQADIVFDPTRIEVVDVTTEGTFANILLQNDYSNELGYIRLTGGVTNPGFAGPSGIFGTVYWRGKVPGLAEVNFLETSLVLANDSRGTNVLKDYARAGYIILPEPISEEEQKHQQDIIIRKQVLGDTSLEPNLDFSVYTEGMDVPFTGILGQSAPTAPSAPQTSNSTLLDSFAQFLSHLDSAILSFWESLFLR